MRQTDIIKIANEKNVPKTTIDKDWVLGHLLNAFYSFVDNRVNFIFKNENLPLPPDRRHATSRKKPACKTISGIIGGG